MWNLVSRVFGSGHDETFQEDQWNASILNSRSEFTEITSRPGYEFRMSPRSAQQMIEDQERVKEKIQQLSLKFIQSYCKYMVCESDLDNLSRTFGTTQGLKDNFFHPSLFQQPDVENSLVQTDGETIRLKLRLLLVRTGIWQYTSQTVNQGVLRYAKGLAPFGLVHAGLQIGPYIIDWTGQGLVLPRKLQSQSPILLAELDNAGSFIEVNTTNIDKICDVIAYWNVQKLYSYQSSETAGNCQMFAKELLDALGFDMDSVSDGFLGKYLEKVKDGDIAMSIEDKTENRIVTFRTHQDIDDYVRDKMQTYTNNSQDFEQMEPEAWRLLKAFDRAFWLMPDKHHVGKDCPFHDPGYHNIKRRPTSTTNQYHACLDQSWVHITFPPSIIVEKNH